MFTHQLHSFRRTVPDARVNSAGLGQCGVDVQQGTAKPPAPALGAPEAAQRAARGSAAPSNSRYPAHGNLEQSHRSKFKSCSQKTTPRMRRDTGPAWQNIWRRCHSRRYISSHFKLSLLLLLDLVKCVFVQEKTVIPKVTPLYFHLLFMTNNLVKTLNKYV